VAKQTLPQVSSSRSFLRSVKLVAWSFFGVRSRQGYQEDLSKVNPLHVVMIGIIGTFLLVIGLILLAKWVVAG
jgi:hypothetical protein